jgi:hypothetical protein
MMFSGFQIDIQGIFIFNSIGNSPIKYQHVYNVRNNFFSDELGSFSDQNITNLCDPNPCKHGGICEMGFNNTKNCLCLENYQGII